MILISGRVSFPALFCFYYAFCALSLIKTDLQFDIILQFENP